MLKTSKFKLASVYFNLRRTTRTMSFRTRKLDVGILYLCSFGEGLEGLVLL